MSGWKRLEHTLGELSMDELSPFENWTVIDFRDPFRGDFYISGSAMKIMYAEKDIEAPRLIISHKLYFLDYRYPLHGERWLDRHNHEFKDVSMYLSYVVTGERPIPKPKRRSWIKAARSCLVRS